MLKGLVTESGELLFEVSIVAVCVSEIGVNQEILENKLVRKGLSKSKNGSSSFSGIIILQAFLTPHCFLFSQRICPVVLADYINMITLLYIYIYLLTFSWFSYAERVNAIVYGVLR